MLEARADGRHRNAGLRKLCSCARRIWAKCQHPWHFNYKHDGEHFRFTLERRINKIVRGADSKWQRDRKTLGARIETKGEALNEAERLRIGIRDGSLLEGNTGGPVLATLTVSKLLESYEREYLKQELAPSTLRNAGYQIAPIGRTVITLPTGAPRAFGEWHVSDVTTGTIEQFRAGRRVAGTVTTNRDLGLLRAAFNWAIRVGYFERTPFKRGTETVVKLSRELRRSRRLEPGEADRLLAACGPHLRAVVGAAIETGCRKGELLSLQWHQVRSEPRQELVLPASKTKTKRDRRIPISTRLRAILAMRRTGPDGVEHPAQAYVFKRAWEAAVLRAHGHQPKRVMLTVARPDGSTGKVFTARLTPESRAQLRTINLHFHDLRREAGSRWLDGGVPLQVIRDWLGHANISQTSTYLESTFASQHDAMRAFEVRLQRIATGSEKGGHEPPLGGTAANSSAQKATEKHH